MSSALDRLNQMLGDVDGLLARHANFVAGAVGRPSSDEGALLRSCVLLIYAAWEVYAEDVMVEVAQALSERDRDDLPAATLDFVGDYARNDPWALADDGWRAVLVKAVDELVHGVKNDPTKWGINSADALHLNEAHERVFGDRFLQRVSWPNANNDTVRRKLAKLIRIRGNIAHRGEAGEPLHLAHVRNWREYVHRLAAGLDARLFDWLDNGAMGGT